VGGTAGSAFPPAVTSNGDAMADDGTADGMLPDDMMALSPADEVMLEEENGPDGHPPEGTGPGAQGDQPRAGDGDADDARRRAVAADAQTGGAQGKAEAPGSQPDGSSQPQGDGATDEMAPQAALAGVTGAAVGGGVGGGADGLDGGRADGLPGDGGAAATAAGAQAPAGELPSGGLAHQDHPTWGASTFLGAGVPAPPTGFEATSDPGSLTTSPDGAGEEDAGGHEAEAPAPPQLRAVGGLDGVNGLEAAGPVLDGAGPDGLAPNPGVICPHRLQQDAGRHQGGPRRAGGASSRRYEQDIPSEGYELRWRIPAAGFQDRGGTLEELCLGHAGGVERPLPPIFGEGTCPTG